MTEEKYKNGDITWINHLGVFKAFDKDGNEIKFPTEGTGYQVTLDVQGILNLCEENKGLKRIEELRIAQIENLKQENKEMKSALEEIREIAKFNQFYNPEDLLINGDIGQIQDLKMTEIYNRINECLGE
jgi:hypothetical protein